MKIAMEKLLEIDRLSLAFADYKLQRASFFIPIPLVYSFYKIL